MYHPKMQQFNRRLKIMFDEVDDWLEDKYGSEYRLHPSRPERGTTSNKSQDGLFNIGPQFTPGYGSEFGRGYVVDLKVSTVDSLSEEQSAQIQEEVRVLLAEKLKAHFPEREMEIKMDLRGLKIIGNFSLGEM